MGPDNVKVLFTLALRLFIPKKKVRDFERDVEINNNNHDNNNNNNNLIIINILL